MSFQSTNFQTVGAWVSRLLRFDFTVFDEVAAQPAATSGALIVVFGASVLAGIGSWLWAIQFDLGEFSKSEVFIKSLVLGSIIQTFVWFLWVYLTYQVLVRAYGARVEFADLVRTMGFAFVPVALNVLIAINSFAIPFGLVAFGMTLLLTNTAIQRAANADAREATVANLTGFAAFVIVMGVFANVLEVRNVGGLAPGILFFSLDF